MGNPQLKPLRTPFAYGLISKVCRVDSGCAGRVNVGRTIPQKLRASRRPITRRLLRSFYKDTSLWVRFVHGKNAQLLGALQTCVRL